MPLSTRYTSFKIDCITLFAFAFAMLAVGEMHIKSKFFLNETYFLKLELHLEIISTTSPMHSSRLPPLEVKFSFNMRHHLPASTGATFVNLSLYFLIPFSFSGAGGPITNFGHQLLLPTQFSFGPGTPGELLSLDPISYNHIARQACRCWKDPALQSQELGTLAMDFSLLRLET